MLIRRLESFAMIAAGLGLALVGGVSLVLAPDTRGLNRLPADRPLFDSAAVLDQDYRDAWEDYLADKLAVASLGRRTNAAIEAHVFADAANATVVRGREGWLYFAPAVSAPLPPDDPAMAQAAINGAEAALSMLQAAGLDARFALAPHKPGQYPQFLPERDQETVAATIAYRNTLRPRFAEVLGANWIDAFEAMETAVRTNPDQLYYLRADTHWTDLGAGVMAKAVVDAFAPGLWDESAFLATGLQSYRPDLVQMEGGDARGQRDGFVVKRPGVDTVRTLGDDATGWRRLYETTADGAPVNGRLVLIGDSYSVALAPLLAPYFEEVAWLRLRDFDPVSAGPVIVQADFALILVVERHVLEPAPLGPAGLEALLAEALSRQAG